MEKPAQSSDLGAVLHGAVGFAVVSMAGFCVWAFGGSLLARTVGEVGLYVVSAGVFILVAGITLHSLVPGPQSLFRFYKAFIPAFLAYSILWSACWFAWGFGVGEWIGSLAGCTAFALILRRMLGSKNNPIAVILALCVAHALGYFLGEKWFMGRAHGTPTFGSLTKSQTALVAKMLYGACYGLGFGAGIGFAFARFRSKSRG